MGVWKFGDGCVVLIWKSPGLEPEETEDEDKESGFASKGKKAKAKILFQDGPEATEVIDAVCEELPAMEKDEQVMATLLRKSLTAKFGTIWHVLTGSKFVVEAAQNCRNHFCIEVGSVRVVGFQHEQLNSGFLGSLDFPQLLSTLPYLLMTLLCFAYMGLSSLCGDKTAQKEDSTSSFGFLRETLCHEKRGCVLQSEVLFFCWSTKTPFQLHLLIGSNDVSLYDRYIQNVLIQTVVL